MDRHIKEQVELSKVLGKKPINNCLAQFYRESQLKITTLEYTGGNLCLFVLFHLHFTT